MRPISASGDQLTVALIAVTAHRGRPHWSPNVAFPRIGLQGGWLENGYKSECSRACSARDD